MRRLALVTVFGTLVLSACNDQSRTPAEPQEGPPAQITICRSPRFPTVDLTNRILAIFPRGPLRVEALARLGIVNLLWLGCKQDKAREAVGSFVGWILRQYQAGKIGDPQQHSGTPEQVSDLIDALLAAVGMSGLDLPLGTGADAGTMSGNGGTGRTSGATLSGKAAMAARNDAFGAGVSWVAVASKRPGPLITEGSSGLAAPSRNLAGPRALALQGTEQFPPYYDVNVSTPTNNHIAVNGYLLVGFCLEDQTTYPEGIQIGHNPVQVNGPLGEPSGLPVFEILTAASPSEYAELVTAGLICPTQVNAPPIGLNFQDGLLHLASSAWRTARHYVGPVTEALFLPEDLQAMARMVVTAGGAGGRTTSYSLFGIVREEENQLNLLVEPSSHDNGSNYFRGSTIRPCSDGCEDIKVRMENGSGTPVGAGTEVKVSLIVVASAAGAEPSLEGTLSRPIHDFTTGSDPGVAVFNDLSINEPGTYKLEFSAEGAAPVTSEEFHVYQFEFTLQPTAAPEGTVQEGQLLGESDPAFEHPVVRVSILDYQGHVVLGASDLILVTLPIDPLTLNGDTQISATDGVANFTQNNSSTNFQTGLSVSIFEGCAGGAPTRRGALLAWAHDADQIQSHPFNIAPVCIN